MTSIELAAFAECSSLTTITLPVSVTAIGDNAFGSCSGLVSAFFQGNAPTSLGLGVFDGAAPNFAIRRNGSASGFANPWNGYPVFDLDAPASRLINLSSRAFVGINANIQIAGFVITGTQPKKVLIRASGPALSPPPYNVPGVLPDPVLTLFHESMVQETNAIWSTAANADEIQATARRVGAFAWAEGSRDSALLVTLAPGLYTAQVSGQSGDTGIALIEIYDAD